jgi:hypothetical protein
LASNTKKRERKTASSLELFFNLIIVIVFTIIVGVAVPSPRVFYHRRRIDDRLGVIKAHRRASFALALLQTRKPLAHLLVRLVDKSVVGAAHGDEGLEANDKNVLLLAPMSGSSRRLRSSRRCMPTSRRSMSIGRSSSRRGTMGCSRGTHSSSSMWRRRRNNRSPDDVRLISSMLAIISEFHLSLEVNDPLDVWSIDHILYPMSEHIHHLCPEKDTNAWRRLIIKNS